MTHTTVRMIAAVVAGVGLVSPSLHTQEPPPTTSSVENAPTFRSGVEAVAFEVFVTDAAGRPVTDLTVDDFGQTFTSNAELLLKAIDKFSGGFPPDPGFPSRSAAPIPDLTINPNTKRRLSGLRDLVDSLAKLPGRNCACGPQSDAHKTTTERAVPIEVRMADAIESQG